MEKGILPHLYQLHFGHRRIKQQVSFWSNQVNELAAYNVEPTLATLHRFVFEL